MNNNDVNKSSQTSKNNTLLLGMENIVKTLFSGVGNIVKTLFSGVENLVKKNPYNPKIHGTNSQILDLFPHTNNELMSPIKMLARYNLAPFSGEVIKGGLSTVTATGDTCFGALSATQHIEYTLNTIINDYASTPAVEDIINDSKENCRDDMKRFPDGNFNLLNSFMICYARAKQLNVDVLTEDEKKQILDSIDKRIKVLLFLKLIGSSIFPNLELIKQEKTCVGSIIMNVITDEHILRLLETYSLDIHSIVAAPTKEDIKTILNMLKIPENIPHEVEGLNGFEVDTTTKRKQFFTTKKYFEESEEDGLNDNYSMQNYRMIVVEPINFYGHCKKNTIGVVLGRLAKYSKFYKENLSFLYRLLHETANKHIDLLQDKKNTLMTLFSSNIDRKINYSTNVYPLIFVMDEVAFNKLPHYIKNVEVRTRCNLRLGQHINLVATDTQENMKRLLAWLEENSLYNVGTCLFSDLETCRVTGEPPAHIVYPQAPDFHEEEKCLIFSKVAAEDERCEVKQDDEDLRVQERSESAGKNMLVKYK